MRSLGEEEQRQPRVSEADSLLLSLAPNPAAFHTDRPAYTVADDSVLAVVVTFVNRMEDTAYLRSFRSEPRSWWLQLWSGDRWVWVHHLIVVEPTDPPITVPPGFTYTHTVRIPSGKLNRALVALQGPVPSDFCTACF